MIDELLARYQPRNPDEAADLTRGRDLIRTTPDPWSRAQPLHLTASALIVHPPTRRVLLRFHPRQQAWLQVGGHADAGEEDPVQIAVREGQEETGLGDLVPWPGPALLHLVVVSVTALRDDPAHEHLDLRFVLATAEPDAARPEQPEAPVRWLTIDEAHALTAEPNLHESLARLDRLLGPAA